MRNYSKPDIDITVLFRPMRADDIDHICSIEKEAFATPWNAGAFYNELMNNHFAHYLVMESNGMIIGYGGMWVIMGEAHLTNVAVRSDYRGRKLGERLLREMQANALDNGASRMTLEVRQSNLVARGLYEKLGFKATGFRRRYYTDNNEDAIIMWAELSEGSGREKDLRGDWG